MQVRHSALGADRSPASSTLENHESLSENQRPPHAGVFRPPSRRAAPNGKKGALLLVLLRYPATLLSRSCLNSVIPTRSSAALESTLISRSKKVPIIPSSLSRSLRH